MNKGTKICFTKERVLPTSQVGGIDEFLEDDDAGICVSPKESYLFIEDQNGKAVIGSFAGEQVDWGSCYLTLVVPYSWIKATV